MRKQMALQRYLLKLKQENEKLQKALKESAVINIETGDVLENNFVNKDNIPELNQILQQYKRVNIETQNALISFEKTVKDDSTKISEIDRMLDGIAIECKQQQDRIDRARELMYEKGDEFTYDNIHIGISSGYMKGTLKDLAPDYEFSYQGHSSSAYLLLVSNYHTAIGYRYAVSQGRLDSEDLKDDLSTGTDPWKYANQEMSLHIFSLGYRIYGIETFNIVPQLQYGVGHAKLSSCYESGCDDTTYIDYNINMAGIEIPFYHQLSSAFSWGFRVAVNRTNFDKYKTYIDGEEQDSDEEEKSNASIETASLGLMMGFAW